MLSDAQLQWQLQDFSNAAKIYVGVFHSDAIVSAGLAALLGDLDDMDVQVLARCEIQTSLSDVIVIDARGAVDYMRLFSGDNCNLRARLLVIAQMGREWDMRAALTAGVHGHVLQSCAPDQLTAAVRALSRGHNYMCAELSYISEAVAIGLTQRETEVLQLMALGHCNKVIARDLGIGVGTVKTYVKGIFYKLGVTKRTQAAVIASRRGLVDDILQEKTVRSWTRLTD